MCVCVFVCVCIRAHRTHLYAYSPRGNLNRSACLCMCVHTCVYVYMQINPCFGQLYSVVKLWAKAQGIHDGTAGMFNSHCLALLVRG